MRLIDTNIIVHTIDRNSSLRERAQEVLSYYMGAGEAVISLQSIAEIYAAVTKWAKPQEAKAAAERTLTTTGFKKISPDEEAISNALSLAEKHNLRRSGVFDALLAATALRHGITTILTENPKHFERLGLKVETLETATLSEGF